MMPGALPDVLVADADSVYLRQLRFDATLEHMVDMKPNYYKSPELTGENRGGDHKYWDNILEGFRHAAFTSPDWFHRSFFQDFPGRRLYCTTGPPDFDDPTENLAAIEGQRKAELLVLRTDDGLTEATYPLDSPPIYDGIASVDGRLYVCTMEGQVACLAAP